MLQQLPAGVQPPTFDQVRYWNKKRSALEREKGRRIGGEIEGVRSEYRGTIDMQPVHQIVDDALVMPDRAELEMQIAQLEQSERKKAVQ